MPRPSPASPTPVALALLVALSHASALELALPTPNDAILRGDGPDYYQFVERTFQGRRSRPWQGGQYGYVRDPAILRSGTIYTRLHEGIDVRPARRDPRGEPLDPILAIDDGTVVHTSPNPRDSNYGRYAVVRHDWDGCPYFSLYAHLASIDARPGDRVRRGARIATLGYSGTGIDRERAHLHLEVNLLLQSRFELWHSTHFPTQPNRHGIYNGLNMIGIDPARLLLESRRKPDLRVPDLLRDEPIAFRVRVPHTRNFELVSRYPWLNRDPAPGHPASWELSFNRAGVPLCARPSDLPADTPTVIDVHPSNTAHPALTHNLVSCSGAARRLTASGQRFFQLLLMP